MLRRRRVVPWLLLCVALLAALGPRRVAGDADFQSVRTGLRKDHSGKPGDPKEKFFRTSPTGSAPSLPPLFPRPPSTYRRRTRLTAASRRPR